LVREFTPPFPPIKEMRSEREYFGHTVEWFTPLLSFSAGI